MRFSKATNRALSYIMALVIFTISIFTFFVISYSMKSVYLNSLSDMTNVATHNIEEHIQLNRNECIFITKMQSFVSYMASYEEGKTATDTARANYAQTFNYIFKKVESTSTIDRINIVDTKNKVLFSNDSYNLDRIFENDSYYVKAMNGGIGSTQIQKRENGEYFILIAQPVRLYDRNVGFLFMELSFDMLNSLINSYRFGDSGNLFFITKDLDIVGDNPSKLPKEISDIGDSENILAMSLKNTAKNYQIHTTKFKTDETDRYMVYADLHNLDAIVATSIERNEVNKTGLTTAFPLIFLLIIIFIMLLMYRFIISKKILHPLSLLERSLYMLKKGDLRARYNYNVDNEFGNLSTVFNQTISNLQETTITLKEREDKNDIILSNITDVVWEYDIEAYTVKMPENWGKLIKLHDLKSEYHYKLDEFMDFIHINDVSELSRKITDCIEKSIPIKLDCQIKQSDDKYIWVKINGSCMYNIYNEPYKIIGSIFDISETKNREDALKEFAKRDDMTGLLKKVEMERIVNIDLNNNNIGHSLLIIDLDSFKSINDTYGHLVGDDVIINTANILIENCKKDCYICRFGGDEFIVYTKLIFTLEQTKNLAEKIINDVKKGISTQDGTHVECSCSIGISRSPIHGSNYVQLMSKADTAIYSVKSHGKNSYAIYNDSL